MTQSRNKEHGAPCSGCFTRTLVSGDSGTPSSGEQDDQFTFNAKISSSIYGKSSSVQVNAYQILTIIKI